MVKKAEAYASTVKRRVLWFKISNATGRRAICFASPELVT